MTTEKVGCVVIGAGVVGLATARALARAGHEVLILEEADAFGQGISSRNSEVIHAGIYYQQGSLKARMCVAGKQLLYQYCRTHQVAYRRCGKLIVATTEQQIDTLRQIKVRAALNGVHDLRWLDSAEAAEFEPEIRCVAALLSPSTGIIDTHGLMLSLLGEAETHGAMLAVGTQVTAIDLSGGAPELTVDDGDDPMTLRADLVVNAAGFGAIPLINRAGVFGTANVPEQVLAKGNYFGMTGTAPVSRLIYPVPEPGGLGVHITLDLAGQIRFGPDVEWTDRYDYAVNPARADAFYAAIRQYLPSLPDGSLVPDYAGLRPKISVNGEVQTDFVISGPADHGVPGWVNLLGIESPGLTSSLAIADHVVELFS